MQAYLFVHFRERTTPDRDMCRLWQALWRKPILSGRMNLLTFLTGLNMEQS